MTFEPDLSATPGPAEPARRHGRWIGPLQVTPVVALVALVWLGSLVFIAFVVLNVHDNQIPLLAAGFIAFGAAWVAIAIGALVATWRAASYARTGRATLLALLGGFAGLVAIGCFSVTALLTLVWNT